MHGSDHMLVVDMATGDLYRLAVNIGKADKLSGGYIGGDGLARDTRGRLYVRGWKTGRIFVLDSQQSAPRQLTDTFKSAADIAIAPDGKHLLVPDMLAGEVVFALT
ncbi:MAG: hypothetical protein M3120_03730 [Pseudomonadota bacterium]|nr:hypothetical protein [Pseudomonadota bacterium]